MKALLRSRFALIRLVDDGRLASSSTMSPSERLSAPTAATSSSATRTSTASGIGGSSASSALVAVSDEDELLDADLISRYVRAHSERRPRHVDLVRWRAFKHYYIAFSPRAQAEVAAWIRAADKRHAVSR